MAVTKADLIEAISERLDLPIAEARSVLEDFLETMKSTLVSGEDLMISGFGRFQVNDSCQSAFKIDPPSASKFDPPKLKKYMGDSS